ncbi:hypothetical protein [Streptomyces cirratus]|uniref:hypothetical protein n=1 Tax=Streptomyces cirratus TaxID=68187 RepID=UPI00360EA471
MTVSSQASITAMQAVTSPKPGDVIEVAGYQTPHDGGGGTFFFDTTHITSAVISTVRITGAGADPSRPGPIVIKAPGHRFTTGQAVLVEGVAGTSANGRWLVAVDPLTPDSFTLLGSRGDGPLMAGDARATSITVTTSSPHGLAPGGRACIAGVVETGDFQAERQPPARRDVDGDRVHPRRQDLGLVRPRRVGRGRRRVLPVQCAVDGPGSRGPLDPTARPR